MKRIPLTQGKYAIVDDEDYELVSKFSWHVLKCGHLWYARCIIYMGRVQKKSLYARMLLHRLVMRPPKNMDIDHCNHNGLDCSQNNMRICLHSKNTQNQKPQKNCSSKYKGVHWFKRTKKWSAYINREGKRYFLGYYNNENDAAKAYNEKAIILFGEFACLNEVAA